MKHSVTKWSSHNLQKYDNNILLILEFKYEQKFFSSRT